MANPFGGGFGTYSFGTSPFGTSSGVADSAPSESDCEQGVGGFGSIGFGGSPFGSADLGNINAADFDLFCFETCETMLGILTDPRVTVTADSGQLQLNYPDPPPPPETTNDLGILSGELGNPGFSTDTVVVSIEPTDGVPQTWTTEWTITFESLPANFSDLVAHHVYIGSSDASGPVAGLFISTIGLAYTGSVHFSGGDIVIDGPVQPIPDTSQYIALGVPITFRIVVDGFLGVTYLFVTPADEVLVSGHTLVAVLPSFNASQMLFDPIEQSLVSVRGTTDLPSRIAVDTWCMSSLALVPNLPPIANAGSDQALRICSIAQLDGTASFDPEGVQVLYHWRLINGPAGSIFVFAGVDGRTFPLALPTGFTDKFHSASLGAAHALDNFVAGDVLQVNGQPFDIVSTGSDGNGFFVLLSGELLAENLSAVSFKVLRQRGISGPSTAKPTFFPDVFGFYMFDLVVSDGSLISLPAVVVVNVVDSPLPRGIVPNLEFVFDYLSDYWSLLEDRDSIATFWSAMAQIAATELYTLWQIDYCKSLRDIQRTFVRRWLHYDLLLAEPVPELTQLRVLYGGLRTLNIPAVGSGGISGTSFTIQSAVHAARTVTILTANPVTAPALAAEIRNRLLEVDSRYTVQVVSFQTTTDQFVRVNAPFTFEVTASTLPVLQTGQNVLASGSGAAIATRTYRVDTSLDGLGIQENDLLQLGDQTFRISQIISDPVDALPFQRVVLKSDIPSGATGWTIGGYVRSELLDFYNGLVAEGDSVYFEVVDLVATGPSTDTSTLVRCTARGVAEDEPSNLLFDPLPLNSAHAMPDRYTVRLAKVVRRSFLPIDSLILDVPTLSEVIEITDDTATLRRNLDFFIDEVRGHHALAFESGRLGGPDVWESEDPPDRLWAEYTHLDNRPVIESNFGILAEVTLDQINALPGSVDYLSAVRGIWYAYVNGPTMFNLRVGAQILLGLPFAEESGTIEEIRTDFSPNLGRILIRDSERTEIVRSYTFPKVLGLETNPSSGTTYVVGDTVSQFAPLVEGVEIVDYVKDQKWFEGLLNQGIFYEVEKYFRFLVRVDSAAFNLDALLFVRDFILKIKPTYTYPLFLVQERVEDTEISVTDEVTSKVTVNLWDSTCGFLNSSTGFDDARSGGGGYWNQFDTDSDTGSPPPTFPVPDAPINWAFDRHAVCPDDVVTAHVCQVYAAPAPVTFDSAFIFDTTLMNDARFERTGPFAVPNGGTGATITPVVGNVVPLNGTITQVRILITGGPGTDPAGYEIVIAINGVDTIFQAFTSGAFFTDFTAVVSQAVTAGQTLTARVRHAGGAPRNPAWTNVRIDVTVTDSLWAFDQVLPVGNYCATRTLA